MWTYIIFASITVASSRHVQYIENSDVVAILDMFGVRSNAQDNIEVSEGFTNDASTRQVGREATEYTNQQFDNHFHHHGHHNHGHRNHGSNGHVPYDHNEDHRRIAGSNEYSTENTHNVNVSSRNTNTNSQKNKHNTRHQDINSTKTNPVTENNTQIIKTEGRNTTKTTIFQTFNNTTVKYNEEPRTPELKESRNVTLGSGVASSVQANASKTDEDRWIWPSETTTPKPTTVGLGDRAAFSGDGCPSSQIKVGNTCVDED